MSGTARNRLASEKSPYLLQHAGNPVDWYPYGPEAFERARSEDRPLFVSIGYSTCHWCHVMERESFEDPATARLMNDLYVNVKIDREERPDVDQIYMRAVMLMHGHGGWPLNVWLTPDLEPFFGGTYFPPDRRHGQPAFCEVLQGLERLYRERPDDVRRRARALHEHLRADVAADPAAAPTPLDTLAETATREILGSFDARHGGFGHAPKFPQPTFLSLLAHRQARAPDEETAHALTHTLECMWRGGIYDHVGGGFARYSTDERWLVPHFEKMLYDNAQLVDACLDASLVSEDETFDDVASDVLEFVAREMTHPEGGFYSAQDADSEGEEGRFYVFTLADLDAALGDDAPLAARLFGATSEGNFEGANILHWPRGVLETAAMEGVDARALRATYADLRGRLRAWRERRVRPGLDDKVLTAWNGLMIGAAARAGVLLEAARWVGLAEDAAAFVDERLRGADGGLLRRWREGEARFAAGLDDHAFLAWGALRLYEATGRARWLALALDLVALFEERFGAADGGLFHDAQASDDLVVRLRDAQDGALPSGNGVAALVLARLGALLEREDLRARAQAMVDVLASQLLKHPRAFPTLVCCATELREGPRSLMIAGDDGDPVFQERLLQAHRQLLPGRVIAPVPDSEREALASLGLPLEGRTAPAGGVAGWLCEAGSCREWAGESC